MRRSLLLILLLCCVPAVAQSAAGLPKLPPHEVVARVNGVELHGEDINHCVGAVVGDFSFHGKIDPSKLNEYRRAALKRAITDELVYQDGLRRHFVVRASKINAEVALVEGRYRTRKDFNNALKRAGLSMQEFRNRIRRSYVIQEVIHKDIISRLKVSKQKVHAYYRKNRSRFHEPAQIHVSEIFVPKGAGAASQIQDVRAKAVAKNTEEAFYQLASQYSKDDYRVMGGDRGWMHQGRMAPELEKAALALHPGQLSPVIQTKSGYFLLRVQGKRAARIVPYAEARGKIRAMFVAQRKAKLRKALLARVHKGAKVKILVKF